MVCCWWFRPRHLAQDVGRLHTEYPVTRSIFYTVLSISVLIVAAVLIGTSVRKLQSTEYGVEYDNVQKFLGGVKGEGLHTGPPGFKFIIFPAVFKSEQINTVCITKDGLPIAINSSFQFVVNRTHIKDLLKRFRDYKTWRDVVYAAAESAVHHGCSDFQVQDYQSSREDVQARQFNLTKIRLQPLHAIVADMQLKNVDAPSMWSDAVQAKEKSREDIELALNERQQALIAAGTTLSVSREQAQRILANATRESQLTLSRAEGQSSTILRQYQTEANTAATIQANLNLTTEGILTYLMNRALESQGSLDIAIQHPAKSSFADEL